MNKKLVIIPIGVVVLVGGIGYGLFSMSQPKGGRDHLTIAEAKSVAAAQPGIVVKVGGEVVPGSVIWDNATQTARFFLTNDGDRLDVVYEGVLPGDFRPGAALAVEGPLGSTGVLEARELLSQSAPLCQVCH